MALTATPQDCVNPGKDMTLYYNVGTCGSPIWVEHLGVTGDLSLNEEDEEQAVQRRRASSRVNEFNPGNTDVSISGQQMTDSNYEGNAFLNSMRAGGTPREVLILTAPIAVVGAMGWRGKFWNFNRSISGPISGEQEQQFSLKPAACTDCPVKTVKVATTNVAADFDPTSFTPVSSGS